MKPIIGTVVLLLCGALIVSSCMPPEDAINPLCGAWTLKGVSCQNCIDKSQEISTTYSCNDSGCNTYTFGADGSLTVFETIGGTPKTIRGSYAVSGSTVSLHLNDGTATTKAYSFSFVGTMLYLKEVVDKSSGKCSSTTVLAK